MKEGATVNKGSMDESKFLFRKSITTKQEDLSNNSRQKPDDASNSNESAKIPLSEIKETFQTAFHKLEVQSSQKVDKLVEQAIKEYQIQKQNNADFSTLAFIQKYKTEADQLEEQVNEDFAQLYEELESELQQNGYDPKQAAQFKDEFNKEKAAKRAALIQEISKKLF